MPKQAPDTNTQLATITLLSELPPEPIRQSLPLVGEQIADKDDANAICLAPNDDKQSDSEAKPLENQADDSQPSLMNSQAAQPEVVAAENNTSTATYYCYEVGPFSRQADWNGWQTQLSARYRSKAIDKPEQVPSHYLVSAVAASPQELDQTIQALKKHRISDYYQHRTPEGGHEISLGVFSSQARALNQQQQLHALGIASRIKIQYKTKSQKHLLIESEQDIAVWLAGLVKSDSPLKITTSGVSNKPCWTESE